MREVKGKEGGELGEEVLSSGLEVGDTDLRSVRKLPVAYILFIVTISTATVLLAASVPYFVRSLFGCMNPTCYDVGYEMAASIDPSKHACDDFYSYVCSGWKLRNSLYPNLFVNLQQRVALSVVKSLILTETNKPLNEQRATDKVAIMFQKCAQVAFNAKNDIDQIITFIEKYGLGFHPGNVKKVDLLDTMVDLSLTQGVPILFQLNIDEYFKKPGRYMLHFSINPYIMEWFMIRSTLIQQGQLFQYFRRFAALVAPKPFSQDVIERLIILDNRVLAAVIPSLDTRPELDLEYFTFEELGNATEPYITTDEWLNTINKYLPEDVQRDKNDEIFIMNKRLIRLLALILGHSRDSQTLRFYVSWHLVRHLAPTASFPLSEAQFPGGSSMILTLGYMLGRCYMDVDAVMPYAFADSFVETWLPKSVIANVRNLVHVVRNITIDSFTNLTWMDAKTKGGAVTKMKRLKEIVGRPVSLSTKEAIDEHYTHIPPMHGTYFDMFLSARNAELAMAKTKLRKNQTATRSVVNIPLTLVNAFYVPIYHVMVIPAAILFSPFYTHQAASALNYGSLGHVVGHEITHAFDPDMGLLDETGIKKNWWTNASREKFEDRLQCLKDMYNTLPWAGGINYGDRALGENFADCGGMQKVFKAYKMQTDQFNLSSEHNIGGMEPYTADQLFFISSCFKWCSHDEKQSVGWYSPPRMRCNVPLMNMKEFSDAFSCPSGSLMNPPKRCDFM